MLIYQRVQNRISACCQCPHLEVGEETSSTLVKIIIKVHSSRSHRPTSLGMGHHFVPFQISWPTLDTHGQNVQFLAGERR